MSHSGHAAGVARPKVPHLKQGAHLGLGLPAVGGGWWELVGGWWRLIGKTTTTTDYSII